MTSQINEIISELKKGLTAEERVQQIKDLNNARNKRYFERHKEAITAKRKAKEAETKLRKENKPPKPTKPKPVLNKKDDDTDDEKEADDPEIIDIFINGNKTQIQVY